MRTYCLRVEYLIRVIIVIHTVIVIGVLFCSGNDDFNSGSVNRNTTCLAKVKQTQKLLHTSRIASQKIE